MAEVFEYELRGKDTSFGTTLKNAVKAVGELKSAGAQVLASFTGGLLGGGIALSVVSAVGLIREMMREANALLDRADKLDVKARVLKQFERTEQTLGLGQGTVAGALESARKARADFEAGDPTAAQAFGRLGLSGQQIQGLTPDQLLLAIGNAFREMGATRENRFALSRIIGEEGENALAPFLAGGLDLGTAKNAPQGTGWIVDRLYAAMNKARFKAEMEPLSTFGLENAERIRRMNESAAEMEARNARALLTADQQRLAITEQRLKLQRQMESEGDPLRRARLRADIAQLTGESLAISAREIRGGMKPVANDLDQLGRAGFFRGAAPDVSTELMRKQLVEMTKILETLRQQPAAIAREL
jgi:hypothetical protein